MHDQTLERIEICRDFDPALGGDDNCETEFNPKQGGSDGDSVGNVGDANLGHPDGGRSYLSHGHM